jgi:hypothetical protein
MKKIVNSKRFWQAATILISALFLANQSAVNPMHKKGYEDSNYGIVKYANASEIYPMFSCPCCGLPLDKDDPCCGAMTEMIYYIDARVSEGLSDNEVVLATAREFGIDRIIDEEERLALRQQLIAMAPEDAPEIKMSETYRDLGSISQGQGIVSTDFEFTNAGKSNLVIDKLSSSCGCTSGAIVYEGVVGPKFSMEGHAEENPKDWQVEIKPGDSAVLRVYYDPSVHPDLTGTVTRTISIMSNDPVDFEVQATITLEQTK